MTHEDAARSAACFGRGDGDQRTTMTFVRLLRECPVLRCGRGALLSVGCGGAGTTEAVGTSTSSTATNKHYDCDISYRSSDHRRDYYHGLIFL